MSRSAKQGKRSTVAVEFSGFQSSLDRSKLTADCEPFGKPEPARALALAECRAALELRLNRSLSTLFASSTGLPLYVQWHQPSPPGRGELPDLLCPAVRGLPTAASRPSTACRACLANRWFGEGHAAGNKRQFVGDCGCTNLCASLWVLGAPLLTLVVQARITRDAAALHPAATERLPKEPEAPEGPIPQTRPHPLTADAFGHAEALLKLIVHDLDATARLRLKQHELDAVHRRLRQDKLAERGRFTQRRRPLAPTPSPEAVGHVPGIHDRQTVDAMLAYVHQHYRHPMALREVAASLEMNANYLSDLFHKTMGVTYHRYLNELRLAKAEELLCDTRACVCDVSCAVGFASANHFRHVFKLHKGLAPRAWRDATVSPDLA